MAGVETIGRKADTSWSLFNQSGGVKSNKKETINPPQSGGSTGSSFNFQDINNAIGSMGGGGMAGDAISGLATSIWGNKNGSFSEDEQATQSAIRKGLEMIPGYGQAIAAATGLVDAIGTATGLNLASVDHDTAKRTGVTGTGFNKVMNMLPGNSMIWGGLSAAFGNGARTDSINVSDEVLGMSDGFSGTVKDLQAAKDLGNKRLFFWQNRQANDYIRDQQKNVALMETIQSVNTQRKQSDYYQDLQNQNINRYAGQNYLGTHVGKNGMKLMSLEEARRIVAMKKAAETEEVEKFQNGGVIGIDTNILPEGSLHKERHHLEEVNPDLEDATKKGIPVMAAEGGEISEQVAEVERDEIVFRLEVTQQLEELMKDGSEEAMIEAGKLVAQEVIENTQDNTGQITEENGKE